MNLATCIRRKSPLAAKIAQKHRELVAAGKISGIDPENEPPKRAEPPAAAKMQVELTAPLVAFSPAEQKIEDRNRLPTMPLAPPLSDEERALGHSKARHPTPAQRAEIRRIIEEVARYHDVDPADIAPPEGVTASRKIYIITARHDAMRRIRRFMPTLSTALMKQIFRCDHTSVGYGLTRDWGAPE